MRIQTLQKRKRANNETRTRALNDNFCENSSRINLDKEKHTKDDESAKSEGQTANPKSAATPAIFFLLLFFCLERQREFSKKSSHKHEAKSHM